MIKIWPLSIEGSDIVEPKGVGDDLADWRLVTNLSG
jgi:hypothetical protein